MLLLLAVLLLYQRNQSLSLESVVLLHLCKEHSFQAQKRLSMLEDQRGEVKGLDKLILHPETPCSLTRLILA